MIGHEGTKGQHLGRQPNRPVLEQQSLFSNILDIIFQTDFDIGSNRPGFEITGPDTGIAGGRKKERLDHVGGGQPKEGGIDKIIKTGLCHNGRHARAETGWQDAGHDFGIHDGTPESQTKGPVRDVTEGLSELKVLGQGRIGHKIIRRTARIVRTDVFFDLRNGIGQSRFDATGQNGRPDGKGFVEISQCGPRNGGNLLQPPHQIQYGGSTQQRPLRTMAADAFGRGSPNELGRRVQSQERFVVGIVPDVGPSLVGNHAALNERDLGARFRGSRRLGRRRHGGGTRQMRERRSRTSTGSSVGRGGCESSGCTGGGGGQQKKA